MKKMAQATIIVLVLVVVFLVGVAVSLNADCQLHRRANEVQQKRMVELNEKNQQLKQEIIKLKSQYKTLDNAKVTAYCPCEECSEGWERQTKSGAVATEGRTVAVDPDVIPLGSKVEVYGKVYVAEDVGGKVEGEHIDIYMENHDATDEFGTKYTEVKVKKEL